MMTPVWHYFERIEMSRTVWPRTVYRYSRWRRESQSRDPEGNLRSAGSRGSGWLSL